MLPYIEQDSGFTTIVDGEPCTVPEGHPSYEKLRDAVKNDNKKFFKENFKPSAAVETTFEGTDVKVKDGGVYYNSHRMKGTLVDRILDYVDRDEDPEPMVKFLDNLMDNPSKQSVEELYDFLKHEGLPITDDGHFLAYKAVSSDYKDKYSGEFDNSVGSVVSMPRNQVDDNRYRNCSTGFHVGAWDYAGPGGYYHDPGNRCMLVKVNPRDAVSVPTDHSCQKLRVCRYEVVGEVEDDDGKLDDVIEKDVDAKGDDKYTFGKDLDGALIHLANKLAKLGELLSPWAVNEIISEIAPQHQVNVMEVYDALHAIFGSEKVEAHLASCRQEASDRIKNYIKG